jgi:hypothetical protein
VVIALFGIAKVTERHRSENAGTAYLAAVRYMGPFRKLRKMNNEACCPLFVAVLLTFMHARWVAIDLVVYSGDQYGSFRENVQRRTMFRRALVAG